MNAENGAKDGGSLPLFETKAARGGTVAYKVFASTIFVGIVFIWLFRLIFLPAVGEPGRWAWICMLLSEVLFSFYWIFTQSVRWNVVRRLPFKDRLSLRYEGRLPDVDIFVCTADPIVEPPNMVIDTVLSVMSCNYPPEKLCIYLSDDGGSEFTFYALLEASDFAKHWLPFCKKFQVEPRAPAAYFERNLDLHGSPVFAQESSKVKKLYEDMKIRIEKAMEKGGISPEMKEKHKGFLEWNSKITKNDHQSIVQILIDGRNPENVDVDGHKLPKLVYLSREKRPQRAHNFKAGSMNSLIRVSSKISNAPVILNLDCDMYSNDPDSIRDALCFFMDEKQGCQVSYVQYPQRYHNVTKNDIYFSVAGVTHEIELSGIDGYDGALYCGTGCFHRRVSLCGMKFSEDNRSELNSSKAEVEGTVEELEETAKLLANCSYEDGTQWGKQMGLVYGCPVEDVVTGLTIQCRGWKPIYYNPRKHAFLGISPTTLDQSLVQHQRWSEGMFQIFLSKYCPFIYGHGKMKFGAQMGYCVYLLWAPVSLATVCYATVPSLCLLHGIHIFQEVSSPWFLPFAYVFVAKYGYSLFEALYCGDTLKKWWNAQRIWLFRRTTSYFLAFTDAVIRQLGLSQMTFTITAKVVDDDVMKRYKNGILEFGSPSIMVIIITTLALLNLLGFLWGIKGFLLDTKASKAFEHFIPQIILSGAVVMVNIPVYQALFLRTDKGRIPFSALWRSILLASVASLLPIY